MWACRATLTWDARPLPAAARPTTSVAPDTFGNGQPSESAFGPRFATMASLAAALGTLTGTRIKDFEGTYDWSVAAPCCCVPSRHGLVSLTTIDIE